MRWGRLVGLDLVAMPMLLLVPFIVFVRHSGYFLLAPETLLCTAGLGLLGILLGIAANSAGNLLRIPLFVACITFLVDFQTASFDAWDMRLAGVALAALVACIALKQHLSTVVSVTAGTLLLSSLILPVGGERTQFKPGSLSPRHSDLPPVIHLVLDEHIGVEGLRLEFDPERRFADKVKNFYLERGFRVFGKAFSIATSSVTSLSNMLNFSLDPRSEIHYQVTGNDFHLTKNSYFETMSARGYRIHVYQTDFMDYCRSGGNISLASCYTYEIATVRSIEHTPLPLTEKTKLMLGIYSRLSFMFDNTRTRYKRFQRIQQSKHRNFPAWKTAGKVSSVSVIPALDQLERDLSTIEPGNLYFIHLMLPHGPYAFEASCDIKPNTSDWLDKNVAAADTGRSQAFLYSLYLAQVECTMQKVAELLDAIERSGQFTDSRIIVHGDHGSRILLVSPDERYESRFNQADYLDAYATLYAVKEPDRRASSASEHYDRRLLSINDLLQMTVFGEPLPESDGPAPPSTVYFGSASGLVPRSMPDFDHGVVR